MNQSAWKLRKLTIMAAIIAMAYVVSLFRVQVVLFLEFEAKDVLLVIAGFLFGAIPGLICSVITAILEFLLNPASSDTQIYGLMMNIISSCLFVGVSSVIYQRKRTLKWAVIALICGALFMTGGMLLWDYFIIPLYMMGVTRADVAPMLLTAFLPFNLLKGALNATITMLLYKPLTTALRSAKLLPSSQSAKSNNSFLPVTILSILILTSLVGALLAWKGII